MRPADFTADSPGTLVPAAFDEFDQGGSLRTVRGYAFVPAPLPPRLERRALLGKLFDVLDEAKSALLRLDGVVSGLPSGTSLLASMRVREAQASSKIEDTVASVHDIALASLPDARDPTSAGEVYRNRLAIEHGLASPLPVSIRLLREMHKVLIIHDKDRPGELRDKQVYIGDKSRGFGHARFVPPPPNQVPTLLAGWETFCNPRIDQNPSIATFPALVELAVAHYQFESIHPFNDGNGRLGRAMVTIAAVKSSLVRHPVCNLSEWVYDHRDEYYERLLRVSTHGEWDKWIEFFCTALAKQAITDLDRANKLAGLYERYSKLITDAQSSAVAFKLLDALFDRQALTISVARNLTGLSYNAAHSHLQRFEQHGIVRPTAEGAVPRVYFADEIIQVIRGERGD